MKQLSRFDDLAVKNVPKLDKKDQKILVMLAEDGRRPINTIAKEVNISPEGCSYRIKRLSEKNILLGFIPEVNFSALGYMTFHLFLLLDEQYSEKHKDLINTCLKHKAVRSVIEYADRWDYEIVMMAQSVRDFDKIFLECLGPYQNIILEKNIITEVKKYYNSPIPYAPTALGEPVTAELEKKDLALLRAIESPVRESTYDMGTKLKMSPDAVSQRLKRLKEKGILKRVSVACNLTNLNYSWYTFAMNLKIYDAHVDSRLKSFAEEPSIIYAARTIGTWDVLFYIAATNMHEYAQTVKKIRAQLSKIIKNYDTWAGVREHGFINIPACVDDIVKK